MKNAKQYEAKIKNLLSGQLPKSVEAPDEPTLRLLLRGVLLENALPDGVEPALKAIEEECVDYNELRVAPLKEVVDRIGRDYPGALRKAHVMHSALNSIFAQGRGISVEYMEEMGKRDLRRHLLELGLTPFSAAYLLLFGFDGHAIPVDQALLDCLEADEGVHPGSGIDDVQGFLERVISQKDAKAAHAFFRSYVEKNWDTVQERRQARQAEQAKAEKAEAEKAKQQENDQKPQASEKQKDSKSGTGKSQDKSPSRGKGKSETQKRTSASKKKNS